MPTWTGPSGTTWQIGEAGGFHTIGTLINALTGELALPMYMTDSEERRRLLQKLDYLETGTVSPYGWRNDAVAYQHVGGYIDPRKIQIVYDDWIDYWTTGDPKMTQEELEAAMMQFYEEPEVFPSGDPTIPPFLIFVAIFVFLAVMR